MYELRKNHIVQIPLSDNKTISGVVEDYTPDRVLVSIAQNSVELAENLRELDELTVFVYTFMGIKKMISNVITELDKNNCIVIENAPAVPVVQKRKFVRVLSSIKFQMLKDNNMINCVCANISAGGVAFFCDNISLHIGELVKFKFSAADFGKEIICKAEIIKKDGELAVGKFYDLNQYDEDRIVKHVFNLIASQ